MIVSDKKISISVIVLIFLLALGYFFAWFGYVEISIDSDEIVSFEIKSREKNYQCRENPCRIKIRVGKKLIGKIEHPLAQNKTVMSDEAKFLATQKIIIEGPKPQPLLEASITRIELSEIAALKSREILFKNTISSNTGPVLIDEKGKFAVFVRPNRENSDVMITNKKSEELITRIKTNIASIILEKNFSLTSDGIVIPTKNAVFYYDFVTQRRQKILDINSLRTSDISVSSQADRVIYFNIKDKKWQKFIRKTNELTDYGTQTFFAGFWGDKEIEVRGNTLYIDGQKSLFIPLKIEPSNDFSLMDNDIFIYQDFESFRLKLL